MSKRVPKRGGGHLQNSLVQIPSRQMSKACTVTETLVTDTNGHNDRARLQVNTQSTGALWYQDKGRRCGSVMHPTAAVFGAQFGYLHAENLDTVWVNVSYRSKLLAERVLCNLVSSELSIISTQRQRQISMSLVVGYISPHPPAGELHANEETHYSKQCCDPNCG